MELTYIQFAGACFISGFAGAFFNEVLRKIEEVYDDYKARRKSQKDDANTKEDNTRSK